METERVLLAKVDELSATDIGRQVRSRLAEFSSFSNRPESDWFSEMCFCILAANAKGRIAFAIQTHLGYGRLSTISCDDLAKVIREHKHRFHNNKASYIVRAREYAPIKSRIQDLLAKKGPLLTREWMVENVYGFGYKEASHYLRNTGHFDMAILDRHVINLLHEHSILKKKPMALTKKIYLRIEKVFQKLAKEANMSCAELDLYLWYLKGGEVLK